MAKEDDDERAIRKLYHRGGHDTEREAAKAIVPRLNYMQRIVYLRAIEFGETGFALVEMQAAFPNYVDSGIRTRVRELSDAGLIEDTGTKRTFPPASNQHIVWRITGRGYAPLPPDPQMELF